MFLTPNHQSTTYNKPTFHSDTETVDHIEKKLCICYQSHDFDCKKE